jgi:hypothetical protein
MPIRHIKTRTTWVHHGHIIYTLAARHCPFGKEHDITLDAIFSEGICTFLV